MDFPETEGAHWRTSLLGHCSPLHPLCAHGEPGVQRLRPASLAGSRTSPESPPWASVGEHRSQAFNLCPVCCSVWGVWKGGVTAQAHLSETASGNPLRHHPLLPFMLAGPQSVSPVMRFFSVGAELWFFPVLPHRHSILL